MMKAKIVRNNRYRNISESLRCLEKLFRLGLVVYLMTNYLVKTYLRLRKSTTSLAVASFLVLLSLLIPANVLFNNSWATSIEVPVYMLTTRGDREEAEGVEEELGYNDKYSLRDINEILINCPEETAIFVHGWGNDHYKAKERLDRVKMSLENNSYFIPLVGLSWDSNTDWDPAKFTAKENGPKLGQFILEYKQTCKYEQNKDVKVRLLGHSMGSRVILSALQSLHQNSTWNNNTNNFKISSVHLMGAAVDDNEVSKDPLDVGNDPVKFAYGDAIQAEVTRFYNLFDPQDNMLQFVYLYFEDSQALGNNGKQAGIDEMSRPPYYDIDVQSQIESIGNADGLADRHLLLCSYFSSEVCEVTIEGYDVGLCAGYVFHYTCTVSVGDNHAGYIGFRNLTNISLLADDGAIDAVVANWHSE
jgi:pimeloyl-ACP methyl ester carboxylesterase